MKIENEFIPYEQALTLKKLGFDELCFGYCLMSFKKDIIKEGIKGCVNSALESHEISLPLYQQAFKWFRDKYNLVHTVYSNASGYIWEIHYNQERGGTHICESGESGDCEMSGMFTTYEKAELECLKKLIEIKKATR